MEAPLASEASKDFSFFASDFLILISKPMSYLDSQQICLKALTSTLSSILVVVSQASGSFTRLVRIFTLKRFISF